MDQRDDLCVGWNPPTVSWHFLSSQTKSQLEKSTAYLSWFVVVTMSCSTTDSDTTKKGKGGPYSITERQLTCLTRLWIMSTLMAVITLIIVTLQPDLTSCYADGSGRPHHGRRTDRSVVFVRWHQRKCPSHTWFLGPTRVCLQRNLNVFSL